MDSRLKFTLTQCWSDMDFWWVTNSKLGKVCPSYIFVRAESPLNTRSCALLQFNGQRGPAICLVTTMCWSFIILLTGGSPWSGYWLIDLSYPSLCAHGHSRARVHLNKDTPLISIPWQQASIINPNKFMDEWRCETPKTWPVIFCNQIKKKIVSERFSDYC